ncbi:MAG: polyprenyl synthetase family protein, partial [Oscillospiraceae bacterium]|nr:polyprenyl synthetase family protein [Oscillospiraceae bacterium]
MAEFESQFRSYRELVESALDDAIADEPGLNAVMRYAVLGGGKRVRGVLTLTFANGAEAAARLAAAIELLHAYTLVHDDLPCMDDDDMRRGKPSAHKAFGEWQALLAGDALQALAFKLASEVGDGFTAILAEAATAVCAGQYMDLEGNADLHALTRCKTAALFVAACKLGALAAD